MADIAPSVGVPDRFLANKRLTPQRWDLVVFRSLQNPAVRHVKRLIGLPGEELVIKERAIWINGVKQLPPPEIDKLSYSASPEGTGEGFGSPEQPMRLGEGEYFVIGDFSLRSADSRSWGALLGKNIEGVVEVIYWPLSRCRLIRGGR